MKKMICVVLALALLAGSVAVVSAEGSSRLGDFASRLKKAAEKQSEQKAVEEPAVDNSYGPALTIDDPFFEKVRSSAYLQENEYSREANVMIELRNVSGRTLYPDDAAIVAYNAAGEVIEEETYAYFGPEMVGDGESLFIWDWFYGFDMPIAEVSHFEVKIESETSSYTEYAGIDGQAMVSDGIAYALVENPFDSDIYGLSAVISIENEEGRLLDVCEASTGNAIGIIPGSVMILRANAEDYETDDYLTQGNAKAFVLYQPE